jgi:predicted nuclease of restriction endonuclease-like RecB superfamily
VIVFPDFALRRRVGPGATTGRRWLVEIVGFWTPDYLARKLARYRAAALPDLILCIDEERRCADGELPPGARVVWYRRRIDPRAVFALIEDPAGR